LFLLFCFVALFVFVFCGWAVVVLMNSTVREKLDAQ
jgi:hypothetical protein